MILEVPLHRQVKISTFAWNRSEVISVKPKVFLQFNKRPCNATKCSV